MRRMVRLRTPAVKTAVVDCWRPQPREAVKRQGAAVVQPVDDVDDAIERLRADYDTTPYTSVSFPASAPGHLAAVAHLMGLETPDVATARVLEIGCATGGNLIPFAAAHPQARVVGLDLSEVQVDLGRARVQALHLDNVEFVAGDIARMDLTALGQFDFIIAHGVYSWVPPEVQDALLSAFRTVLSAEGVAYMSYNTYPGWKSKEVLRDAMLLASGSSAAPDEKARAARGMVDFLEEVVPADGVLARVLTEFRSHSEGFGDSYLLHEELETFNSPCYFYEMLARARAHGLAFLGEAHPEAMFPGQLRSQGRGALGREVRRYSSAGRAIHRFRRQPHVPRIAACPCRTRAADPVPPRPHPYPPAAHRRVRASRR
jgi:SAM-dependent methyltransferase